jgi:hypothetical protein
MSISLYCTTKVAFKTSIRSRAIASYFSEHLGFEMTKLP